MSRTFKNFRAFILEKSNAIKFFKDHNPGQRIVPINIPKENAKHQLRFDAGEVTNGRKNLYLQINTEATNSALKTHRSKHGTHENLAMTSIDMSVPPEKQEEEIRRALDDVERQFGAKIG